MYTRAADELITIAQQTQDNREFTEQLKAKIKCLLIQVSFIFLTYIL